MYTERKKLYESLEEKLESKVLVYVTSDRAGYETQIGGDAIDLFIDQLDNGTADCVKIPAQNSKKRQNMQQMGCKSA